MPSKDANFSYLFSCVDIPSIGQRESVWFLARSDLERGTEEMDDWLNEVAPHLQEVLPVNRMT